MIRLAWIFTKMFFRNSRAVVMAVFVPSVIYLALAFVEAEGVIRFSNVGSSYQDFLLAGMITFATLQLCLYTTAYTLIDYKRGGILKRFALTPLSAREFLTAETIARFVIGLIQAVILLMVGVFLFGTELRLALLALPLIILIASAVLITFGFIVAAIAIDYEDAAPYTTVIAISLNFVGDTFFPAASLPGFLPRFSEFLPLRPISELLRFSILGTQTGHIMQNILVLGVWLIVLSVFSWGLFARKAYK